MIPIAWITLRRITEPAVLIQFGVLALVLMYIGLGLESVILTDETGSKDVGLGVAGIFLCVFTIFWSTIEIQREVARKEVHVYLAKPISRLHYVIGKFIGMASMVLAGEVVLLGIFSICLIIKGHRPDALFLFGAARVGLFLILLNAVCTAASVVLAEVPALVAVLALWFVSSITFAAAVMAWSSFNPLPAAAMALGYHLLPDLLHFRWDPADGHLSSYLGELAIYTAGWVTLFIAFAWGCFSRRDLP